MGKKSQSDKKTVKRPPRLYFNKRKKQYYIKVLGKKKYLKLDEGMSYKEILGVIIKYFLKAKKRNAGSKKEKSKKGVEPIPAALQSVGWSSDQAKKIVEDAQRDARFLREMILTLNVQQPLAIQGAQPPLAIQGAPQVPMLGGPQQGNDFVGFNIKNLKREEFFDVLEQLKDQSPYANIRQFAASVLDDKVKAQTARELKAQISEAKMELEELMKENAEKEADMNTKMTRITSDLKTKELETSRALADLEKEKQEKEAAVILAVDNLNMTQQMKEKETKRRIAELEADFQQREKDMKQELDRLVLERAAHAVRLSDAQQEAKLAREESDRVAVEKATLKAEMEAIQEEARQTKKNRDLLLDEMNRTGIESDEMKAKLDAESKKLQQIATELEAKRAEIKDISEKKDKLKDRLIGMRDAARNVQERQKTAIIQRMANTTAGSGSLMEAWKEIFGENEFKGVSKKGDHLMSLLENPSEATVIIDRVVRSYDGKVWNEDKAFKKAGTEIASYAAKKIKDRRAAAGKPVDPEDQPDGPEPVQPEEPDEIDALLDETKDYKLPESKRSAEPDGPTDRRTLKQKLIDSMKDLTAEEKAALLSGTLTETEAKDETLPSTIPTPPPLSTIPTPPPLSTIPAPPPLIPSGPQQDVVRSMPGARAAAKPAPVATLDADAVAKAAQAREARKEAERKALEEEATDPEKKAAGDARRAEEKKRNEEAEAARKAERQRLDAEKQRLLDEEAARDPAKLAAREKQKAEAAERKKKREDAAAAEEARKKALSGIATAKLKPRVLTEEEIKEREEKKRQREADAKESNRIEKERKDREEAKRIAADKAKNPTRYVGDKDPFKEAMDSLTPEQKKLPYEKQIKLATKKMKILRREAKETSEKEEARQAEEDRKAREEQEKEAQRQAEQQARQPQQTAPATSPDATLSDQAGSGFIAPILHNGIRLKLGRLMTTYDMKGMGHIAKPLGEQVGLSTTDISDIMMKYWPIYRGTFAIDEFASVPLKVSDGEAAMVINLSPSTDAGTHWVALFISFPEAEINYYDSYAEEPSLYFLHQLDKLIDRANPDVYLKFKYNRVKQQRVDSDTCGFHAMKFLVDRIEGKNWKDASGWSEVQKGEKEIKSFKHKYGYV